MDSDLEKEFDLFWDKFVKEFYDNHLPDGYELAKSTFLVSYRIGYAKGCADAGRVSSSKEEIRLGVE